MRYVIIPIFIFSLMLIAKPSEEDIKKCMGATGWDYNRCNMELTR